MVAREAVVAQLAALVAEATGNVLPPPRLGFLAEVAERRAQALGMAAAADYVGALAAGRLPHEWESLVPLLTIKESYFFRAPQQFEAIESQLLPRLLRARAGSRRLRAWSAACARGEEPATLAMLFAGHPALEGWDWSILATDLDAEALAGARRGLYGERAVAAVPPLLLERWFRRRGKLFELAPELRSRIDYRTLNLAQPPFVLPEIEYDLILLRNVLIYFDRPLQSWAMAHVAQLLGRRGALFLGASETLWQIQDELEAVDLGSCFCYRHRRTRQAAAPAPPALPELPELPEVSVPGAGPDQAPAPRRAAPGHAPPPRLAVAPAMTEPAPPTIAPAPARTPKAAPGTAASGEEAPRSGDAASPGPRSTLEMLLAAAHELAANRIDAARRAVDAALAADASEPAGHLLDGFLHDVGGRAEDAAASYRAALYLDPSLFQARLLLADCLVRLGQRPRAAHEYREVLATLAAGRERTLAIYDGLPLPSRERALSRCRQALHSS